jgi:WhiB family redox-sensing transcriptional regulator
MPRGHSQADFEAPAKKTKSDWRHRAACANQDPELFFPIGDTTMARAQAEEAKAVCRRCPVMEACGNWALATGQDAGVWGALTEAERRSMRRRAARERLKAAS